MGLLLSGDMVLGSRQSLPPIHSPLAADPVFTEIVAQFVSELPARLAALEAAAERADRELLRRLAHQLKGSAGSYGFAPVTEASWRLEDAVVEQRQMSEVLAAVEDLRDLIARVRPGKPH